MSAVYDATEASSTAEASEGDMPLFTFDTSLAASSADSSAAEPDASAAHDGTSGPGLLALPGTRLAWVELYNWGTFHNRVTRLELNGLNTLLTGNIGSGKSTLVDAVTTLLASTSKFTFNQAAGAGRSERNVKTYALGQFRHLRDDDDGSHKPEYLRSPVGTQSVVLAGFTRHRPGSTQTETITAGLVITFTGGTTAGSATPVKTYLLAPVALGIKSQLLGHDNISALRKSVKAAGGQWWEDNFTQYQKEMLKALDVSRQGLSTFVQTVSMKQVGDLTGFVRAHMLDHLDMNKEIDAVLAHYDDLISLHNKVIDARAQLEVLSKVKEDSDAYERALGRLAVTGQVRDTINQRVDNARHERLTAIIDEQDNLLPELTAAVTEAKNNEQAATDRVNDLTVQIQNAGGADLTLAEKAVDDAKQALGVAVEAHRELATLAASAGVTAPADRSEFGGFLTHLAARRAELDRLEETWGQRSYEINKTFFTARDEKNAIENELKTAGRRPSNIPEPYTIQRDELARTLDVEPGQVPFAGELVKVNDPAWELAAERLLGPFALDVLVPHDLLPKASAWLETRNTGLKFVLQDVRDADTGQVPTPRPDTIAGKLAVRGGDRFSRYVAVEVARRFTHVCVTDPSDLVRHPRAVTREGQVRDGGRHEKDDRPFSRDRRKFVLGWDTGARRRHLESLLPAAETALAEAEKAVGALTAEKKVLDNGLYAARQLSERFTDAALVDVPAFEDAVRAAEAHRDELAANPKLAALIELLEKARRAVGQRVAERGEAEKAVWACEQERDNAWKARLLLTVAEVVLEGPAQTLWAELLGVIGQAPDDVVEVEGWGRDLMATLNQRASSAESTRDRNRLDLANSIGAFKNKWPQHCDEIDLKDLDTRSVLLARRIALETDDLPKWTAQFQERLEKNAIKEIVAFSRKLDVAATTIRTRLDVINRSLRTVDYRPGNYIRLDPNETTDLVVRAFRAELTEITEGTVGAEGEAYSEERFLLVRELLDKFTGRDGEAEKDRKWVAKVTDVRQWFTFSASERVKDTDVEVEQYQDSDGKSGGQKEKLAYTILAASLAYQYGLAEGDEAAFRFVMIDEAFAKGSDESTEFGLEMFSSLGLQVLVVTPLLKLRTIEPYVGAVGFAQVKTDKLGREVSELVSMSIEQWIEATPTLRGASAQPAATSAAPDPE